MKIEKGKLIVDVRELVEALNPDDLRDVARTAAFNVEIIECLCKWLTTGEVDWDDEDGVPWYIFTTAKGGILENARKALLPLMSDIAQKFIADLMSERDFYESLYEQYKKKLWELERIWRNSEFPPRCGIDYSRKYYSKEDAAEAIKAFEKTIRKQVLDELTRQAQELNMGYDDVENKE